MTQENIEFHPSLPWKIVDVVFPKPDFVPPTEIVVGLFRASRPYMRALEGKIADPTKVKEITENYGLWYGRLYDWFHRND